MLTVKQGGLLIGFVAMLVLTAGALKLWQTWQRSHFSCEGEMRVFTQSGNADITMRYMFSGDKGMIVLRGIVTPQQGKQQAINHNVWFSFTRKGDDFFLNSQNVTSNVAGASVPTILPVFYQRVGEPFYLRITRIDSNNRLLSTSRVPSLMCRS